MEKKQITELTKEELIEAVGDGIYKGFWSPLLSALVITGFLIIGVFILLSYIFSPANETTPGAQVPEIEPNCFALEHLYCHVLVGNETTETNTGYFSICGYQEANAKFEQSKPEIQEWLDEDHPSWRVKKLECEP